MTIAPDLSFYPPVALAPMAGITNAPFRRLCAAAGAQLCISEMVIAHTLVDGSREALQLVRFRGDEALRSVQLYGTKPGSLEKVHRSYQRMWYNMPFSRLISHTR